MNLSQKDIPIEMDRVWTLVMRLRTGPQSSDDIEKLKTYNATLGRMLNNYESDQLEYLSYNELWLAKQIKWAADLYLSKVALSSQLIDV